jgi:hypothetical protein
MYIRCLIPREDVPCPGLSPPFSLLLIYPRNYRFAVCSGVGRPGIGESRLPGTSYVLSSDLI